MTITTNAAQVIKQLKAYSNSLEQKMKTFVERLAKIGLEKAIQGYSTAQYDGMPDDEVINPRWVGDDTLEIGFRGKTILFIEFGTGTYEYPELHPLAGEFPQYQRGEYGHHLGKLKSWRYQGVKGPRGVAEESEDHPGWLVTKGNPANRVLYDASKEMRSKIQEIAKEVFQS